jgi:hypothetical protein
MRSLDEFLSDVIAEWCEFASGLTQKPPDYEKLAL